MNVRDLDSLRVRETVTGSDFVAVIGSVAVSVPSDVNDLDNVASGDAVPREGVTDTEGVTLGVIVPEADTDFENDWDVVNVLLETVTATVAVAVGSADGDSEGLPRERDTVCSGVSVMVGSEL